MAIWLGCDELDFNGAVAVAGGWLGRARRHLEDVAERPEHGWLAFFEGYVASWNGETARTLELAASTAAAGRRLGVPDLEMVGLALEGATLVSGARVDEGMRRLDEATATATGFGSVEEALADLPGDGPITVLAMHLVDDPDPRDELSHDTHIADVEKLKRQIERYRPHFDLIAEFPGRRAPDLAEMLGKETLVFKREVRRLKELGLTHSLRVGYRVSPRGEALRTLLD